MAKVRSRNDLNGKNNYGLHFLELLAQQYHPGEIPLKFQSVKMLRHSKYFAESHSINSYYSTLDSLAGQGQSHV